MKPKLTAEELQDKKRRDSLKYIANRIKAEWSFGAIKTYHDLLSVAGYSEKDILQKYFQSELQHEVSFHDVKEFISDMHISLETEIWLRKNPPVIELEQISKEIELHDHDKIIEPIQKEERKPPEYKLDPSPNEKAFHFWFQKKVIRQLLDDLLKEQLRAHLLIAATGYGKTFMAGGFLRRLLDMDYARGKTLSPWPYCYITKASDLIQTQRVFKEFYNIDPVNDVLTINIDQLRSEFGKRFVRQEIIIDKGEESCVWKWRKNIYPIVILWNECQALKNQGSQQSQIAQSYNEIDDDNIYQCFISATPGTRVNEFKCVSVASRVPYDFGIQKGVPLTNDHWNDFAKNIASDWGRLKDIGPADHSPGAVERLMTYLDRYTIRVTGVRPQFKAINNIQMIAFATTEGKEFYDTAIERFLEKKAKIEADEEMSAGQRNINILVALLQFRIAAESNPDRVRHIAKAMWESVQKHNQAAVAALNFKVSIVKIVDCLVNVYNVPREQISLIWGGAPQESEKQKKKKKIESNVALQEALKAEGITLEDLDLDEVEDFIEIDETLKAKLKPQNAKQRQKEIDKFQKGESLYCLYTFRAGGVGLSLHHTDEYTNEKVRHKESGYAYVEDIPRISTRQRICFVAPTYSAIELVQGLGRCPRLTSLSDTPQLMIFFRGTVEEKVARIVGMKLRCLSKVVRQKESWESMIIGHNPAQEEQKLLAEAAEQIREADAAGDLDNNEVIGEQSENGENED